MTKMTLVGISDTHGIRPELPRADVVIHAGDACNVGTEDEFRSFLKWFSRLQPLHKIFVPGNHDRYPYSFQEAAKRKCEDLGIHFLVDRELSINGVHFYGYPWTPVFGKTRGFAHARDYDPFQLRSISQNLDVLITHGPPAGILDRCPLPVGCSYLAEKVAELQPKYHLFGHIHPEHGGIKHRQWGSGRETYFVNLCRVGPKEGLAGYSHPVNDPVFTFQLTEPLSE